MVIKNDHVFNLDIEEIAGYFGIGYTAVSQTAFRIKREMMENRRTNRIVGELKTKLLNEE